MADFRDFDRFILPFMGNPPLFAVDDALLDAAIDFCDRTRVITEISDRVPVIAGESTLDVEASTDLVSAGVISVYTTSGKLVPKTKRELDELYLKGWMFETAAEMQGLKYWLSLSREQIRLVPYPEFTDSAGISYELALKPARDARELPDVLYEHYAEIIAVGAMARLHSHPNVSYSKAAMVSGYSSAFESGVTMASDEHVRGVNKPVLRTGMDEFR